MAFGSSPEPCIPTPICPNRMRSLGATDWAASGVAASRRIVLAASKPPAATAPVRNSSRREGAFFTKVSSLLLQWLDSDFFKEHYVVVAVILQSEPAKIGAQAAFWLEAELLFRDRIAFLVVHHLHAIQRHHCVRAVQRDLHRVPFRPRFPGCGEGFRE